MTTLYGPQRERLLSRLTDEAEREEQRLLGKISGRGTYRPQRSEANTAERLKAAGEIEEAHPGEYRLTWTGKRRVREVFGR